MRLALISDIHANLDALETVLEHIDSQKIDVIHCLGDVIGYGPEPAACIEKIDSTCKVKLLGNHEYVALGLLKKDNMNPSAKSSAEWTQSQLGDREISFMADYDLQTEEESCQLVHSSPFEPDKWHYLLSMHEAKRALESLDQSVCFFGHTHIPMVFSVETDGTIRQRSGMDFKIDPNKKYLINVGSVGQPRDDDPRACYVIFDTSENSATFNRIEYDVKKAQSKMIAAELPEMLIERLEVGR